MPSIPDKPVASAPASASAAPRAPLPSSPQPPAAWTDEDTLARLAKDCHYAPATDAEGAGAFSCEIQLDQTCNWNECDGEQETCTKACTASCQGCSEACAKQCDACKAPCKDDACRRACAVGCGSCRQGCLRDKDHCATGACAQTVEACSVKLHKDWEASPCFKLADKLHGCIDKCLDALTKKGVDVDFTKSHECQSNCESKVMPGCSRFFSFYRVL